MEIIKRFFMAFEALVLQEKIKSLTAFCNEYGLYRIKYQKLRTLVSKKKETAYKDIDAIAIGYLVKDFGVSAEWVLLGRGEMFN